MTKSVVRTKRFEYLDSIRGIAAVLVVFYHYFGWNVGEGKLFGDSRLYNSACLVINGSDAVSFFFVLSGLVLSYKYFHTNSPLRIRKYTWDRFWRLVPPFAIAVLMNYLYLKRGLGIRMIPDLFWYNDNRMWQEFFMMRGRHDLYIPGWTLGIEMALSLLLPFFILTAKKHGKYLFYGLFVVLIVGGGYISGFMVHFCLGMILAKYFKVIQRMNFKKQRWYPYRYGIWLLVFVLFSMRHIDRFFGLGMEGHTNFVAFKVTHFLLSGIASFFILVAVINSRRLQRILEKNWLTYIGKISYGIYLMHWLPVYFYGVKLANKFKSNTELPTDLRFFAKFFGEFVVVLLVTWLLSHLMYFYVEKPIIKWSKRKSAAFYKGAKR